MWMCHVERLLCALETNFYTYTRARQQFRLSGKLPSPREQSRIFNQYGGRVDAVLLVQFPAALCYRSYLYRKQTSNSIIFICFLAWVPP